MSRTLGAGALLLLAACGGAPPATTGESFYERYQAVRGLSDRRDEGALRETVRLLEDPHPLVVVGALETLGEIGDPGFLQHVAGGFGHESPLVREQACITAVQLGNPEATPLLLEALKDADTAVRRAAVKATAAYGAQPGAVPALVRMVGDADPGVALLAHERLQRLTGRTDVERTPAAWEKALP